MLAATSKHRGLLTLLLIGALVVASAASAAGTGTKPHVKRTVDRVAPTAPTNIQVTNSTATMVSVSWHPATDNVGVAGYLVYIDAQRSWTSTTTYTAQRLECGESVSVAVVAVDRAGNRSARATSIVSTAACLDTTPPSSPRGFRQEATTQTAVVLGWEPSSDDVGVVGYGVYRNGLPAGNTASPITTLTGLSCASEYVYEVDAIDAAGNRSSRRSAWVATAPCSDSEPPVMPVTLAFSTQTATSLTVAWTAATDNVGIAGYEIALNGVTVATTTRTSAALDGLECGTTYNVAVTAYDGAGNRSESARGSSSTTQCAAPTPPPPPSSPADTTPPMQPASLTITGATVTEISLSWAGATDNVGVAGYGVYVDGAVVQTTASRSAAVSGLTCGTAYTVGVDAYDAAGNRSTRIVVTTSTAACADTRAPSVPSGVTATTRTATSIALSWAQSTDNVAVVGYGLYLNGSLVGPSSSTSGIFSGLICNTNYTLAVDAYDAAGNRSAKAIVMVATTACPDTTPPSAPTNVAAGTVTQTSLVLSWRASTDNLGVAGYEVSRNGTKVASVTGTSSDQTGLACGTSYSFAVRAFDAAGNVSPQGQLSAATAACPTPTAAPPPPPPPSSTGTVRDVYPGQSIESAVNASAGGDTIRVHAGSYPAVTLSKSFSTPLQIVGEPGVVIGGIVLANASGYEFDRIRSEVPATSTCCNASAFYINGTSSNVTLRNSTLRGGFVTLKQYAAYPSWSRAITIVDNDIAGGGGDLIHIDGADDVLIEHNFLHDPAQTGAHNDAFQIQRGNNWRVLRNTMTWSSIPKGAGSDQAMMVSEALGTDTVTNGVIANNLVHHWHGGRPLIISNVDGPIAVVNNTFVASGDGIAITVTGNNGPVAGVSIWNNIVQSVYYERGASAALLDTNWYTEPQWGNAQGANARTGSPGFLDTSSFDLTSSSPARALGLELSGTPSNRIDGSVRGTPPGLGAW